jgi:hypothetical protein
MRRTLMARHALAAKHRLPLIATNDVHMHEAARRPLADVLACVREGVTIDNAGTRLSANAERHLKSPREMKRIFREAPEAIEETLTFLRGLSFSLDQLAYEYPDELREGFASEQEALEAFSWAGATFRYPAGVPDTISAAIRHELALVAQMRYAAYFLTVHDIVRFARGRGILCQGRGSAANSTICFCLGITEVDPTKHDLLFERFISPERKEPPDIDVDFEHERREEVMQYIYNRYGRLRAGLTATVISYRARSAIRDVGKVFGFSEDSVKNVPPGHVVIVDGQRSGRSAKAISNIAVQKAISLLAEGVRDGAVARAAHDTLKLLKSVQLFLHFLVAAFNFRLETRVHCLEMLQHGLPPLVAPLQVAGAHVFDAVARQLVVEGLALAAAALGNVAGDSDRAALTGEGEGASGFARFGGFLLCLCDGGVADDCAKTVSLTNVKSSPSSMGSPSVLVSSLSVRSRTFSASLTSASSSSRAFPRD